MKKLITSLRALFAGPVSAPNLFSIVPPTSMGMLGRWEEAFPAYDEVIGFSALGHFFVRSSTDSDYAVIHPFDVALKSYGEFTSVDEFKSDVLEDAGFQGYVLLPGHVAAIHRRLGPLGKDEIYIPEPYPFLGGSEEPETYAKGNVWVFANILGQMVHLNTDQ